MAMAIRHHVSTSPPNTTRLQGGNLKDALSVARRRCRDAEVALRRDGPFWVVTSAVPSFSWEGVDSTWEKTSEGLHLSTIKEAFIHMSHDPRDGVLK